MKMFRKTGFVLLAISSLVVNSTGLASAQDTTATTCDCVTSPTDVTGPLGIFSTTTGDVLYSGTNGTERAGPGAPLVSGSHITVPGSSSAIISVGLSCNNLFLPENSVASISQPGGPGTDICVNIDDHAPAAFEAAAAPAVQEAAGSPLLPLLVVGAVIGGAVALGGGDGDGDSPPPASN